MFGLLESVGGLEGRTDLFADWALPSFRHPARLPLSVRSARAQPNNRSLASGIWQKPPTQRVSRRISTPLPLPEMRLERRQPRNNGRRASAVSRLGVCEKEGCYEEYRPHSYSKGRSTRVGAAFIINETVCEISAPMGALEWNTR